MKTTLLSLALSSVLFVLACASARGDGPAPPLRGATFAVS
jgi:hypothetical protein